MNRLGSSFLTFIPVGTLNLPNHAPGAISKPGVVLLYIAFISCVSTFGFAQEHPYLTSAIVTTQQRLQSPSEDHIHETIGEILETLSKVYDLPIWMDRSIARDSIIALDGGIETLGSCLDRIADRANAKVVILENLVFIAPKEKADALSLIYWELKSIKLPAEWNTIDKASFSWKNGASSVEVASSLCQFSKLDSDWVTGLEHDHLAAFSFAKVNRLAVTVSVLGNFGVAPQWVDGKMQVVALNASDRAPKTVEWTYTATQIQRIGADHWKAWKAMHPTANHRKVGSDWAIESTPDAHRALVRPLIPIKKWTKPKSNVALYTLKLQGSLESAVTTLSQQLKLDLAPLPLPDKVGKREIQIAMRDATVDAILREIGRVGGLEFRKTGQRYEIQILEVP